MRDSAAQPDPKAFSTPLAPIMATPTPTVPLMAMPRPRSQTGGAATAVATGVFKGQSPAAAADAVWVPLISGVLIVVAGAMSLATGKPWLFAGLGPTAVMIAATPGHPTTRFRNIVVGHVVAFACAWLALLLLGVGKAPTLLSGQAIPVVRVWASALAVAVTVLVQPSLRAYHPPAAATALLVTLGVYRTNWSTSASLLGGVVVIALLGEWFQRLRIANRPARR